jgi:hypothetical protein
MIEARDAVACDPVRAQFPDNPFDDLQVIAESSGPFEMLAVGRLVHSTFKPLDNI